MNNKTILLATMLLFALISSAQAQCSTHCCATMPLISPPPTVSIFNPYMSGLPLSAQCSSGPCGSSIPGTYAQCWAGCDPATGLCISTCGNGICEDRANFESPIETEATCCDDCGCSSGTCVANSCVAAVTTTTSAASAASHTVKGMLGDITTSALDIVCVVFCVIITVFASIAALALILTGLKLIAADTPAERADLRNRIMYILLGLIILVVVCPLLKTIFISTAIDVSTAGPCNCNCALIFSWI